MGHSLVIPVKFNSVNEFFLFFAKQRIAMLNNLCARDFFYGYGDALIRVVPHQPLIWFNASYEGLAIRNWKCRGVYFNALILPLAISIAPEILRFHTISN